MKGAIREEYSNALNFSDGDIYRHIRYSQNRNENDHEAKWQARLSESKRRDLKQLHKLSESDGKMRKFRDSLDALIPYIGLWPALKLGTFHRLLTLRCPEELTQYLIRVKSTWDYILGDGVDLPWELDAHTVCTVEGRNPCYSAEDLALVEASMRRNEIFPCLAFEGHRESVVGRLCSVKHMIPSLHTFLEDTKYLEPCAKIMRGLLGSKVHGSVQQAFDRQHNGQKAVVTQDDEERTTEQFFQDGCQARWMAYRQLWLFAWRHFPEMTGVAPRKDPRTAKPIAPGVEYNWWHGMSQLARKCGYANIPNVYHDADEAMTRDFLRHARPPQVYRFDETVFDANVRRICDSLKEIKPHSLEVEPPSVCTDRDSCGADLSSRCGRPFERAFLADKGHLFLRYIYPDEPYEPQRKQYLTSFAVKRDIFHSFFGGGGTSSTQAIVERPPSPHEQGTANATGLTAPVAPRTSVARPSPHLDPSATPLTTHSEASAPTHTSIVHTPPPLDASAPPLTTHVEDSNPARTPAMQTPQAVIATLPRTTRDTLTVVKPHLSFENGRLHVENYPIYDDRRNLHLIEALNLGGTNVYMDFDSRKGCSFIAGLEIVRHPRNVKNVVVVTPVGLVNKMKELWESKAMVSLQ